eukprot:scaffold257293_cov14-Tisochrysis_lutea.AAC.1
MHVGSTHEPREAVNSVEYSSADTHCSFQVQKQEFRHTHRHVGEWVLGLFLRIGASTKDQGKRKHGHAPHGGDPERLLEPGCGWSFQS